MKGKKINMEKHEIERILKETERIRKNNEEEEEMRNIEISDLRHIFGFED